MFMTYKFNSLEMAALSITVMIQGKTSMLMLSRLKILAILTDRPWLYNYEI